MVARMLISRGTAGMLEALASDTDSSQARHRPNSPASADKESGLASTELKIVLRRAS